LWIYFKIFAPHTNIIPIRFIEINEPPKSVPAGKSNNGLDRITQEIKTFHSVQYNKGAPVTATHREIFMVLHNCFGTGSEYT